MKKNPKISVIVPVFNEKQWVNECLSRITTQTLRDIEIICVDDGSQDGSLATLLSWKQADERISVLTQKNSGAAAARNNGLRKSSGEFVCFIDADDFYPDDNVLEVLYRTAIENNVNISGGGLVRYDSTRESDLIHDCEYSFLDSRLNCFSNYQCDCGFTRFVYKRSFLVDNNIFFPEICYYEGEVFLVRALSVTKEFYSINRCVYCYRENHKTHNEDKLSRTQIVGFLRGARILLNLTNKDYPELHNKIVQRINHPSFAAPIAELVDNEIANLLADAFGAINWRFVFAQDPDFEPSDRYLNSFPFNPRVSVVVPVYNVEGYLKKCLDSIRNQTYKNIEVLCVDNRSTDNSAAIIEEFCNIDPRFKHLKQSTQGLAPTRNKGLDCASGYFVYFVDSDDYIAPNTIELLITKMQSGVDFVVHGVRNLPETDQDQAIAETCQRWFDSFRKPEGKYRLSSNFRKDVPSVAVNKLYRLQTISKHTLRFVNLVNEDEHFLWAYLIHSKWFYHLNDELYFYRRRSNSIMGKRDSTEGVLDIIKVYDEIFSLVQKEGGMPKYRKALCHNFKSEMKSLFKRIDSRYKNDAFSLVRSFVFNKWGWDWTLVLFYLKLVFKYKVLS